jgi:hypothetical protein
MSNKLYVTELWENTYRETSLGLMIYSNFFAVIRTVPSYPILVAL